MTREQKLFADGSRVEVNEHPFGAPPSRIETWRRQAEDAEPWRPFREVLTRRVDPELEARVASELESVKARLEDEARTGMEALGAAALELGRAREAILRESEGELIALSLAIAEQILGVAIEEHRDFTARMADHAIGILTEADTITLRVAPRFVDAVRVHLAEHGSPDRNVTCVEDASVDEPGVVAECAFGRVDATLSRRLRDARMRLTGKDGTDDTP